MKEKVQGYLEYWIGALGLSDWELTIEYGEIDGAYAETKPHQTYDSAKLQFDLKKLKKESDSFVERTVIHELLHLLDRDRENLISQIEQHLNPEVFKLFENVIEQNTESFIDKLATILFNQRGNDDLRGHWEQRDTTNGIRNDARDRRETGFKGLDPS